MEHLFKQDRTHAAVLRIVQQRIASGRSYTSVALSESMAPLIVSGDRITVGRCDAERIRRGDIIAVGAPYGIRIHRVIDAAPRNGAMRIVTRGDRSPRVDPICAARDVLGIVMTIEKQRFVINLDSRTGRVVSAVSRVIARAGLGWHRAKQSVRTFITASATFPILGSMYRAAYRLGWQLAERIIGRFPGVRSVYLRNSFAHQSHLPGRSDIDITVVYSADAQSEFIGRFRRRAAWAKRFVPFLGEIDLATEREFSRAARYSIRGADYRSWRLSSGDAQSIPAYEYRLEKYLLDQLSVGYSRFIALRRLLSRSTARLTHEERAECERDMLELCRWSWNVAQDEHVSSRSQLPGRYRDSVTSACASSERFPREIFVRNLLSELEAGLTGRLRECEPAFRTFVLEFEKSPANSDRFPTLSALVAAAHYEAQLSFFAEHHHTSVSAPLLVQGVITNLRRALSAASDWSSPASIYQLDPGQGRAMLVRFTVAAAHTVSTGMPPADFDSMLDAVESALLDRSEKERLRRAGPSQVKPITPKPFSKVEMRAWNKAVYPLLARLLTRAEEQEALLPGVRRECSLGFL